MNVLNKVALQGLKKNRTRTFVTIIGVVLSAGMITAVATFGTSLLNYLVNSSISKYGNWHVEFLDVDPTFVKEQGNKEEVANTTTFTTIGYALLDGSKSPEKPYLFIAGFNNKTFDTLPISLISGRLPENHSEILVPTHVAAKGGIRLPVGDTLTLPIGQRIKGSKILGQHDPYPVENEPEKMQEILATTAKKTYTVVGIYERPGFEEHSAPGYTLITKADTADQTDRLNLFVTLKNPLKVKAYASSIANAGAYVFNDYLLRFMGVSDNRLFNALLLSVGGILVVIIMIGSIFLIYNSFNISLNERTHQFGILSSVGATASQMRNSVMFEGICIGAIGIPIGILVGIGSVGLVIPIVARNFGIISSSTEPLTLSVSALAIAVATVVSLVTILISAYIPARKAANTPVMESIRQTNEIKTESKDVKTSELTQRIYGLEGTLALKNFKRNKKRYRSVVLSLVLSVVLFVSGSSFGKTLKRLSQLYTMDFDYDICFYTQDIDDDELFQLYEKMKIVDGVYESSYQAISTYSTEVNTSDFSESYRKTTDYNVASETVELSMDIQFIEDSIYKTFIESLGLSTAEYMGEDAKMIIVAKEKSGLIDIFKKDSMDFTLSTKSGNQLKTLHTTFVDTYPEDTLPVHSSEVKPYILMAIAPYQMKSQFDTFNAPTKLGLTFRSETPTQSASEIDKVIQGAGFTSEYTLYNLYEVIDQYRSITFVIDVFTYIFVITISLIAIANVFNTISTNIKMRRRELAMLRSMGMSDHSFNKMMNFECIFYGMRTLLFGIPITGIISWLIYEGMMTAEKLDNFKFEFPWGSMAISVLSVFLIVFITMLYATSKIRKENIIDALRDDMT